MEESEEDIPPAGGGVGGAEVGPSQAGGASTSYSIPEYPREIPYMDFVQLKQYQIPDVPVDDERMGALAHVSDEEMGLFRLREVAELLRSYFNAYGLLTFAAPFPIEYMGKYRRRLAGDVTATYHPSRSRSRSAVPSQFVQQSGQTFRLAPLPQGQGRTAPESSAEGVGEMEAKRPRTMDPPPSPQC